MNSELRRDTLRVALRSEARGMEVIESDARHIDSGRREDVGICEDGLVGFVGLGALLEAAAVCDAAEDARDELGIIRVTEAAEDLVLRGWVEIDTNVKRVLVFEKVGLLV